MLSRELGNDLLTSINPFYHSVLSTSEYGDLSKFLQLTPARHPPVLGPRTLELHVLKPESSTEHCHGALLGTSKCWTCLLLVGWRLYAQGFLPKSSDSVLAMLTAFPTKIKTERLVASIKGYRNIRKTYFPTLARNPSQNISNRFNIIPLFPTSLINTFHLPCSS